MYVDARWATEVYTGIVCVRERVEGG